jgi:hypothetical protein
MPLPNPGTPPTIAALPEAPLRNQDGPTFNNKAAPFVAALDPFGDDVDAVGTWMKSAADFTEEQAGFAEDSATAAEVSRAAAYNVANFKGSWSSLTGALNKPATVLHQGAYWALLNNLADVTASQPGVTSDWAFTSGTRWRTPYTASATMVANSQNTIEATSAPADMSLPTFVTNDFIVLHNSNGSTQQVRLMNSAYTIIGRKGSVLAGTNLIIRAGDTLHLVAISSSILEVV